jgi:RNA polymerase sigma-70 factor (ECF subfamily)
MSRRTGRDQLQRVVSAGEDHIEGAPEDAPDAALVRATLSGDEGADAREDAEDVVQDTFRRVFEKLDRFDPARSFEPWFFTILRNTARNAVKSRRIRAHDALTIEHASTSPGPYEETRRLELRQSIAEAMERLPAMQKTCFRLCVVEGLSSAEAANAIGLAESTVRVHVFKARRALQELLDVWREEAEES